jgi:mono/diheme cytochrome c family protein
MPVRGRAVRTVMFFGVATLVAVSTFLYRYITSGGLTAVQEPSAIEAFIAQRLLTLSVPASAKLHKNPLDAGEANLIAGRALYQSKCESCHGYDGSGKGGSSGALYPPPANLTAFERHGTTDGELFYFIRNGIRNTGMPAFPMPDRETWQLVLHIRNLPKGAPRALRRRPRVPLPGPRGRPTTWARQPAANATRGSTTGGRRPAWPTS